MKFNFCLLIISISVFLSTCDNIEHIIINKGDLIINNDLFSKEIIL